MAAKSDFWLHVHDLAVSLHHEASDNNDAVRNIAFAFHSLPAVTQDDLIKDITLLIAKLPEVKGYLESQQ